MKAQGIQSLINLREEATESEFFAQQSGINYLHIPVVDWQLSTIDQVERFLDFISTEENRPVLIHCSADVGRTGTFVACYRIVQGVPVEDAVRLSNSGSPLQGVTMNGIQQDFARKYRSQTTQ